MSFKLGTLQKTVNAFSGRGQFILSEGSVVVARGDVLTRHYVVLKPPNNEVAQFEQIYFVFQQDLDDALYSPLDELVDCMINKGFTLKHLRAHQKADQL